jgi:hypothetical protein
MNPITLATVNTRLRNSSSGRIGSAARLSTAANATSSTMPVPSSAIMPAESHGYVVPPRLV